MEKEWQDEFTKTHAVIEDGTIIHYGDPQAEARHVAKGDASCVLSHMGIIHVSGADAATFLQGQLSNDIAETKQGSQLSAYCTAQGRMVTIFRIIRNKEDFLLILPQSLQETVLKRLKMFVLRAKVTLSTEHSFTIIGLVGPGIPSLLAQWQVPVPLYPHVAEATDVSIISLPGPHMRYMILGPSATVLSYWQKSTQLLARVGTHAWRWLDIVAGLPTITPATSEAFVPQMANLDLIGGIAFRKGCYPGQEIVARTHYLGRLKQRMYRATLPAQSPLPQPGATLTAPNLPGQTAGTIIDAQYDPDGKIDLLAIIQISSHDEGSVYYAETALCFTDLPYPLAANS